MKKIILLSFLSVFLLSGCSTVITSMSIPSDSAFENSNLKYKILGLVSVSIPYESIQIGKRKGIIQTLLDEAKKTYPDANNIIRISIQKSIFTGTLDQTYLIEGLAIQVLN